MKLQVMSNRCGTTRGVVSNSREVGVYDSNNELIRSFGSVNELERKSEKYLGFPVAQQTIRRFCKNGKLYAGKYYFKMKDNYMF